MPKKELTKSKLNKILKKYRVKLEQHDKEWEAICRKKCSRTFDGDHVKITGPSLADHERHNSKGAQLFKSIMEEFDEFEVFPKKD